MRRLVSTLFLMLALAGCLGGSDAPAPEPAGSAEDDDPPGAPLRDVDFTWDLLDPEPGQLVMFSATAPGATSFAWDFGDGDTGTGPDAPHVFDAAGVYEVLLIASYPEGPDATASHIVTVGTIVAEPSAADPVISWETDELTTRFSFTFAGTAEAIGWDFGDGTTSNDEAPVHAYARPGTYIVALRVFSIDRVYQANAEVVIDTDLPVFRISDVGRDGPEPSLGVTSDGCIFFIARTDVMRSCDQGLSWADVSGTLAPLVDSDPYLWVDTETDRVFRVNMLSLECTQIGFTDDGGASWIQNPADCGVVPGNDHIKLASGPWPEGSQLGNDASYERAVYFCVNKVPPGSTATAAGGVGALNTGVHCSVSLDGGLTFPIGNYARILGTGLHGAIEVAPDGTVYVPPRYATPTVLVSKDAGLTWVERSTGGDTPDPRKNSEVATDTASNAYHVWIGKDFGVYMSRSSDGGNHWDRVPLRISPDHLPSATFPHIDAGDPGRIAIAYLASADHAGNPHTAPDDAHYHLFVTFSLNALDDEPAFTTVQVTDDPVQVGSICISSGSCQGGNRNLLDFNDLHIGPDGRVHVAFADGCSGACSTNPSIGSSRGARGAVAILDSGPSLYADVGLAPL